ncbi:Zn 2cys6 transcription factor protein [Purpureocillium lilacinum]|uniref:Zn 2cys6 transcription factor protein n=1 Tax=Purpureocillium lilacinum TaxID=33203 RepID=A0A179HCB1_PURLI|nr:Zn 2cys6 transcription factor protein [Purpureocillium lilacinum]
MSSPECRSRKIKCDERKPRCGQCMRRDRVCHLQDSVFKRHAFSFEAESTPTRSSQLIDGCRIADITATAGNSYRDDLQSNNNSATSPSTTGPDGLHETTIEALKDTQEELFLLRHYSECIAPWMDLLYRYEVFSREVLMLARKHPILRYAACAVAAKQLGQMRAPVATVLRGTTQERIAERLVRGRLGFVWYGIKYYEKAIQTLVKSITPKEPQATTANHPSPAVSLSKGDLMVRADGEDPIVRLLGTCILIQYEHLSANRDAWSGHLTGFSKLLDLIDGGKLLEQHPIYEQVYPWTKDIMEVKAGFWNFVVNDLEESFVSHRRTRINTENLALWRNMGLLIEDYGRTTLTSGPYSLSTTAEHVRDKVLCYSLIRLMCKLVCHLAPASEWEALSVASGEPRPTTRTFTSLEGEFDAWYEMLSPSFYPDGKFSTPADAGGAEGSGLFSQEIWFSNDLCSTTMMYYHMARLLLLIHRPSHLLSASPAGSGGSFDLLRAFRETEQKLRLHASEVISIVRERKGLVEILTGIQDSLGIATGYRVKALLQEWGMSYQEFGMEARLTAEEQLG